MAINDFYLVTLSGIAESQQIVNNFTYKATNSSCTASDVRTGFNDLLFPAIKDVLSSAYKFDYIRIINLRDASDFTVSPYPPSTLGNNTGDYLPMASSIAVQSPTKNRTIRGGAKRFSPVSKGWSLGNQVALQTAVTDRLAELAIQLCAELIVVGVEMAVPVIIKRIKSFVNGKPVYTLPSVATSSNHYVADNWDWLPTIRSQNTRKR